MFNALLRDMTRSDRDLNQVDLELMGVCSGRSEYLYLSKRGFGSSFFSKFAINMLSISNLHALEFEGFFQNNPARQPYMARFLRLSARVGFAVDEMERLYDQMEYLPSIELLAERVQMMDNSVRNFVDNSHPGTEPPILFRELFRNSTGDGLYDERPAHKGDTFGYPSGLQRLQVFIDCESSINYLRRSRWDITQSYYFD